MDDFFAWAEFSLKVIGAIAVVTALLLTWRTHAERSKFEMIDRLYSLCHVLESHLLRDWYLAHMFCIGDDEYERVKSEIQLHVQLDPSRIPEYVVKEKLFAIHVFVVYEQIYYQWVHSSNRFHKQRRQFLGEILSYFTDRLITNPRLLHFVQSDKTGASLHLEPCSKSNLDQVIGPTGTSGVGRMIDQHGPFIAQGAVPAKR